MKYIFTYSIVFFVIVLIFQDWFDKFGILTTEQSKTNYLLWTICAGIYSILIKIKQQ